MADVETQARSLGWVPKEEFRGDATRWVDAETFVRRGEEIMPILRSNNKRLEGQVESLTAQLTEAQQAIKESQESMQALIQHQSETTKAAVADTKARLKAQIRVARENNDWEALDELEEQMDSVKETERALASKPAATPAPTKAPVANAPAVDPEFIAWQAKNDWFGKDKRRTALMFAEAEEMRANPAFNDLKGRAFYEKAAEAADAILNPRSPHSKVDGGTGNGTPSSSGGGNNGKSFADLPTEAKNACDDLARTLVGPNRAFKTKEAWQKHYAEQFFAQE